MTSSDHVREIIFQLLSNSEVDTISSAATKARLGNGDEYIDLQELELGVQRIRGTARPAGDVLVRKAIYEDTWRKVVRQLTAAHG
jgi:hypothetical protein